MGLPHPASRHPTRNPALPHPTRDTPTTTPVREGDGRLPCQTGWRRPISPRSWGRTKTPSLATRERCRGVPLAVSLSHGDHALHFESQYRAGCLLEWGACNTHPNLPAPRHILLGSWSGEGRGGGAPHHLHPNLGLLLLEVCIVCQFFALTCPPCRAVVFVPSVPHPCNP